MFLVIMRYQIKICINGNCNDGTTQQTNKRITATRGDALEIIKI